jgi:outer membrane protein assembly factor BamB
VVPISRFMVEARGDDDPGFIGNYRVLARLGSGGFGTVYAARADAPGSELVAVKRVHRHVVEETPDFQGRFEREIRAMQQVTSRFVPNLVDADSAADLPWLVTDLIPGPSLARVVGWCGRLPEAAVWRLGQGIADALAAIHAADCVHRDLKSQNVLLVPDRPWIIDFSLARVAGTPRHPSSRLALATLQYAAPEQLRSLEQAGRPADVFGLGATLLYAATGHPPHEGASAEQLVFRGMHAKPNLDGLPGGRLGRLVESCLSFGPGDRPSVAELRAEFARPGVGHGALWTVLPRDVLARLDTFQRELALAIRARGPAELGWRVDQEGLTEQPLPAPEAVLVPLVAASSGADTAPAAPAAPENNRQQQLPPPRWGARAPRDGAADSDEEVIVLGTSDFPTIVRGRAAERERPKWKRQIDSMICAPVAVHRGRCVVVSLDGTVAVLRTDNGAPAWRPVRLGASISEPAVIVPAPHGDGGEAFVGLSDGSVHAIDLISGTDRTALQPGSAVAGPLAAVSQWVYVVRSDGTLHRLDARAKKEKPIVTIREGASGALTATVGTVFVADDSGAVHIIDPAAGRDLRQLRTGGRVLGTPVAVADRVYVVGTDAKLREFGIEDGDERAVADLGSAPVHIAPAYDRGVLYIGDADGFVYAYNVGARGSDPEQLWPEPYRLGSEVIGLAAADGLVLAAAGDQVVEIDALTGVGLRERIRLKSLIAAAPVVAQGYAYVVGLGGGIRCFATR